MIDDHGTDVFMKGSKHLWPQPTYDMARCLTKQSLPLTASKGHHSDYATLDSHSFLLSVTFYAFLGTFRFGYRSHMWPCHVAVGQWAGR